MFKLDDDALRTNLQPDKGDDNRLALQITHPSFAPLREASQNKKRSKLKLYDCLTSYEKAKAKRFTAGLKLTEVIGPCTLCPLMLTATISSHQTKSASIYANYI